VQGLRTKGCTALGPALTLSVALASDRSLSSEIILCTDGVPNTGVGSLSGRRDTTGFYSTVSIKGVTVMRWSLMFVLLVDWRIC